MCVCVCVWIGAWEKPENNNHIYSAVRCRTQPNHILLLLDGWQRRRSHISIRRHTYNHIRFINYTMGSHTNRPDDGDRLRQIGTEKEKKILKERKYGMSSIWPINRKIKSVLFEKNTFFFLLSTERFVRVECVRAVGKHIRMMLWMNEMDECTLGALNATSSLVENNTPRHRRRSHANDNNDAMMTNRFQSKER